MKWPLPSLRLGQSAMSGLVMTGLLLLGARIAVGAEDKSPAGRPVLGKNADGYLEVFKVEADGELLHRWQKRASGDWSSWASLGGAVLNRLQGEGGGGEIPQSLRTESSIARLLIGAT